MDITAIVIPADEDQPLRVEQIPQVGLDEKQRLVGGYLQAINLETPPATVYIDDEGKIKEKPLNYRATRILWVHNALFRFRDVLMGDVFIVGPPDKEGDDTPAPDELVQLLGKTDQYAVELQNKGEERWFRFPLEFTDSKSAYTCAIDQAARWDAVQDVRVIAA